MARIIIGGLMLVAFMGCQKPEPKPQAVTIEAPSATIEVKTAKCESCARTITKALEDVDGVKKASVDLSKKIVFVEYVSSKTDLASLETAISKAGYDANSTKRDDNAYHSLDACCQ